MGHVVVIERIDNLLYLEVLLLGILIFLMVMSF